MTRYQHVQLAGVFVTVLVYSISASLAETTKQIPSIGSMVEESLSCMKEFYLEPLGIQVPRLSVSIHPYQPGDELLAIHVTLASLDDETPSLEVSFHFVNGHLVFIGANGNIISSAPSAAGLSMEEREQRTLTRLAKRLRCERFAAVGARELLDGTKVRRYRAEGRPCAASGVDILAISGLLFAAGVP